MLVGIVSNNRDAQLFTVKYLQTQQNFELLQTKLPSKNSSRDYDDDCSNWFESDGELLDFCTARWTENFVIPLTPLNSSIREWKDRISAFRKRPFFICIGVESNINLVKNIPWCSVFSLCDVITIADCQREEDEHEVLLGIGDILQERLFSPGLAMDILRPPWDSYFLQLAELAAHRSNCMKRRVGAILARNHRVISTGYNGTPGGLKNCNEGGCQRCNNISAENGCGKNLDSCLCLHAEENALLEAGNSRSAGATLYCCTCPCLGCAKKIVQARVARVVYGKSYGGAHLDDLSRQIFDSAGIIVEQLETFTSRLPIVLE